MSDREDTRDPKKTIAEGLGFDENYERAKHREDPRDPEAVIAAGSLFDPKYDAHPVAEIKTKADVIADINKSYGFITLKGKTRILERGTNELLEKEAFFDKFTDRRMDVGTAESRKLKTFAQIWFDSELRRVIKRIVFKPPPNNLWVQFNEHNLFKGWAIKPVKGDVRRYLRFMAKVICNRNMRDCRYLVALICDMFQEPGDKPGIAVVIQGEEGVGKSFFIETLRALAEGYSFKTSNPDNVFGNHNGQLKNVVLLHLEEAIWAGSKKDESLLKELITGDTIDINDKFVPVYEVDNNLHVFITGNPDWLVAAGFKARRIFALRASEAHIRDIPYFKGLYNWLHQEGGLAALMYFFEHFKYNKDALRMAPVTDELIRQKKQSQKGPFEWWSGVVESKELPFGNVQPDGRIYVIKKEMYQYYSGSASGRKYSLSDISFGLAFGELLPRHLNGREIKKPNGHIESLLSKENTVKCYNHAGKRVDAYNIPSPAECQALLDFKLSGKYVAPSSIDEWIVTELTFVEREEMKVKELKDALRSVEMLEPKNSREKF